MGVRSKGLLTCLLGALALPALCLADGIRATVDRAEATIEDQIRLTLTIEGSRSARPQLPELPDFEVYSRGQSTQMSFVNGEVTSSVSYSYVLAPKRTGTLVIAPASVELDGRIFTSEPIRIRIVEASEQPQDSRELFVSTKVSTTQAWVGQEVLYIWRFYRRVRIGDARLEPQEFRGFLVEDLGDVREYRATVNGVEYLVSEIRKSLFPQEEGTLLIPASSLTVQALVRRSRAASPFDDLFGSPPTETKVLRSRQIEIEVRPLPDPPPGFSGLVGDFEIDARISKAVLEVGESATLKLTVSGSGNVQMISEPSFPELPRFKIYDDRPVGQVERSGARLTGSRTFSMALVPLAPGEEMIPPIELTYFDPDGGGYRQKSTAAIALEVKPAQSQEDLNLTESLAPTTGKVAVRILADDLIPIRTRSQAVEASWVERLSAWLLWTGLLLPPLVFLGTLLFERRRLRYASDVRLRRRHRARRRLRRCLGELRKASDDPTADSRQASRCLREYIGDKLGMEGLALTAADIDQELRSHGVDEELVERAHRLLARLEASQFGGLSFEAQEAVREIESVAVALERQMR